ncbi:MAG: CD1247 N-terminal domain-containing protein [Lachnospirales bacterium]
MTISEKVAYLKGLAEGLNLDTEKSKEGKLISVMIGILEEVGLSLEDLDENTTALGEELDAVSDDLADVEEIVYGDDEDEDECGCGCEDEDFFEVECPNCGEDLEIDESVLETGSVECPNCGEKFAIDLSDEDDGCGCGCGCDHDHGEDK